MPFFFHEILYILYMNDIMEIINWKCQKKVLKAESQVKIAIAIVNAHINLCMVLVKAV